MEILFKARRVRISQVNNEYTAFKVFSKMSGMGFFGRLPYYIEFDNVNELYKFLGWLIFEAEHDNYLINSRNDFLNFRKNLIKLIMDNQKFLEEHYDSTIY